GHAPPEALEALRERWGYYAGLQGSDDPQDESRLENLAELVSVAAEFEAQAEEEDALASEYEDEADAPATDTPGTEAPETEAPGAPGADIAPDAALTAPDDPAASQIGRAHV